MIRKLAHLIFCLIITAFSSSKVIAQQANPVIWKSQYNQFSSSDFYIRIGSTRYYGQGNVNVYGTNGDPYATLEISWREHEHPMRMYMYFKRVDTNMWEMYDLRTYNNTGNDWIYFSPKDSLGNTISSLLGYRNFAANRAFLPVDQNIDAEISCRDCSITAFTPQLAPLSEFGYGINFTIGLPSDEAITISNDPNTGYGVNAILVDSSQKTVTNQADFYYHWGVDNQDIATIYTQSVPYPDNQCAYHVEPPCPYSNVQISGHKPGVTQVYLEVARNSDQKVIATNSFPVKVIASNPVSPSSPSPSPSLSPTKSQEITQIQEELTKLQGEVGVMRKEVNSQAEEISTIRRIINQIQAFFTRLFRR